MLKKRNLQAKDFLKMTKDEQEIFLGRATKKAISETHAMGLPTTHSDGKYRFKLYPDGRKEILGETDPL